MSAGNEQPPAIEQIDPDTFLEEHGLQDIAEETIHAHGQEFTVREAVLECPPLAKMIGSMSVALGDIQGKAEILKNSIMNAGEGASEDPAIAEAAAKKKVN